MILNNSTPEILSRFSGTKFFLLLLISGSLCFTSCNESSVVGLDVQPSNDLLNVGFQDTTTLITKTIREDSLRTDELVVTGATSLIGKYIDPVFGTHTASLYTQVILPTGISTNGFGAGATCDSIILSLVYDPVYYYGSKERKQQTIEIFEVTETIPNGEKYSNKTLAAATPLAAAYNFIPRPNDSVTVYGIRLKPQLRIPLDQNFGKKLLDDGNAGVNLASNVAFLNYLKGLYITTKNTTLLPGEGNIMNFRLSESRITLYYNTGPGGTDSLKYEFGLGGVARFTNFTHDYSGVDLNLASQLGGTPPANNDLVFLQGMSGLKTKIEMPNIMHWADSGAISINKAELVIKLDPNATYQKDTFTVPPTLILFGIDDDGKNFLLPDWYEGSNYHGGNYYSVTNEYRFNIGRYVQQILSGQLNNNGMHLIVSGGAIYGNRVVIGGGKNTSAYQMKLNITYTKLH